MQPLSNLVFDIEKGSEELRAVSEVNKEREINEHLIKT